MGIYFEREKEDGIGKRKGKKKSQERKEEGEKEKKRKFRMRKRRAICGFILKEKRWLDRVKRGMEKIESREERMMRKGKRKKI
jgi:hypothetical protein